MRASELAEIFDIAVMPCSCGFKFKVSGVIDRRKTFDSAILQLNACKTEDICKGLNDRPQYGMLRPVEASFVQIPLADVLSSNDVSAFHHLSGQPSQKKTTTVSTVSNEDNCQSALPRHAVEGNNDDYMHCASSLYRVTISNADCPALCRRCTHRIERALETDSDRLLAEALIYEKTIQQDEADLKGFQQIVQRAVRNALQSIEDEEVLASDLLPTPSKNFNEFHNSVEGAFMREIQALERACQKHRAELVQLRVVQKEQAYLYEEIEHIAYSIAAEQNALELEGRALDSDQKHLSKVLADCHNETERLSSSAICPPVLLVHLHVDFERGLRYPLINELRLAFRPKGDVDWNEIQAAWALASNLLLMIATIFKFQAQSWKIVPLSRCAKLICCPQDMAESTCGDNILHRPSKARKNQVIVLNIGHPKTNKSKALLMWNDLLCQVIQHVVAKNSQAVKNGIYDTVNIPPVPYEISSTIIGGVSLAQLGESDDTEWSRVIHFMASNLLWLSKCSSIYIVHHVVLTATLRNTST